MLLLPKRWDRLERVQERAKAFKRESLSGMSSWDFREILLSSFFKNVQKPYTRHLVCVCVCLLRVELVTYYAHALSPSIFIL